MEFSMTLEDLTEGLDLAPRAGGIGRKKVPFSAEVTRELSLQDLGVESALDQCIPAPVKSLRHRHHALARLLAEGTLGNNEISALTGYTPSRISILKSDPAFSELVEHYKGEVKEIFRTNQERLKELAQEASDILLERLDQEPESFSQNQLMELVKIGADRTGDGVSSSQKVEHSLNGVSSDIIAQIKGAVSGRQNGQANKIEQKTIIDVEFEEV